MQGQPALAEKEFGMQKLKTGIALLAGVAIGITTMACIAMADSEELPRSTDAPGISQPVEPSQPESPIESEPLTEAPIEEPPALNQGTTPPLEEHIPTGGDAADDLIGAILEWEDNTLECGVLATVHVEKDEYGNNWAMCLPID